MRMKPLPLEIFKSVCIFSGTPGSYRCPFAFLELVQIYCTVKSCKNCEMITMGRYNER